MVSTACVWQTVPRRGRGTAAYQDTGGCFCHLTAPSAFVNNAWGKTSGGEKRKTNRHTANGMAFRKKRLLCDADLSLPTWFLLSFLSALLLLFLMIYVCFMLEFFFSATLALLGKKLSRLWWMRLKERRADTMTRSTVSVKCAEEWGDGW